MIRLNRNYISVHSSFIIDKAIIKIGTSYDFDFYGHNDKNDNISLICEKNFPLTKNIYKELLSTRYLYVFSKDKKLYEKYYIENIEKRKTKNLDLSNLLSHANEAAYKLFQDPDSLNNLQDLQEIVSATVSLILKDDSVLISALSVFSHDYYTHTHSVHVKIYSLCLGKKLGFSKQRLEELGTAALLHDLGKSKISKEILNKKGKLTLEEFEQMKKHPLFGYEIAKKLNIKSNNILEGIRNHHEKVDGSGYPDKLKSNKININARIIGICDVFDALSSKRSYKEPLSAYRTLNKMKAEMSSHLDINILKEFILMLHVK